MELVIENVASVYEGKKGQCCCGCSGTHFYAEALREEAAKSRGYEVRDEEINDSAVERIFDKVMNACYKDVLNINDTCYSMTEGQTLYVVYMKGH